MEERCAAFEEWQEGNDAAAPPSQMHPKRKRRQVERLNIIAVSGQFWTKQKSAGGNGEKMKGAGTMAVPYNYDENVAEDFIHHARYRERAEGGCGIVVVKSGATAGGDEGQGGADKGMALEDGGATGRGISAAREPGAEGASERGWTDGQDLQVAGESKAAEAAWRLSGSMQEAHLREPGEPHMNEVRARGEDKQSAHEGEGEGGGVSDRRTVRAFGEREIERGEEGESAPRSARRTVPGVHPAARRLITVRVRDCGV
jgi:hypothetical protein